MTDFKKLMPDLLRHFYLQNGITIINALSRPPLSQEHVYI